MTEYTLQEALDELRQLVNCRCHPDFKDRGLQDPQCQCDYADVVEAVAAHAEALTAKLAQAVAALERAKASIESGGGGGVIDVVWLDDPCPQTLCDFIDATLEKLKGESHD